MLPQKSRVPAVMWGLTALAGVGFALLCALVAVGQTIPFDAPVYRWTAGFISPGLTSFAAAFTNLGDTPVLLPLAAVLLVWCWRRGAVWRGVAIVVNLGSAALCNALIKQVFLRPRPEELRLIEIHGYSFPSGHSFTAMAFYGLLIYCIVTLCRGRWKWAACAGLGVLIVAIGLSRIYLGVHYPSDVAAGFCGGWIWLVCYTRIPPVRRALGVLAPTRREDG